MVDNSKYKKEHDLVIEFVKSQIGVNLNDYRNGDGTNPNMTTYWDINGCKVCVDWCSRFGGMDRNSQISITRLVNNSKGKLSLEWGGAWFKYIYFKN